MNRLQVTAPGGPGAPYYSDFYFDDSTAGAGVNQSLELADFWAQLAQVINVAYVATFDGQVQQMDVTTGQVIGIETVPSWTKPGATNTEMLPRSNQGIITLHSGVYVAGREVRGRKFIWGPNEADSTNGSPNTPYIEALRLSALALVDGGVQWCVYSPTHHVAHEITSGFVNGYWAVLRSRRD